VTQNVNPKPVLLLRGGSALLLLALGVIAAASGCSSDSKKPDGAAGCSASGCGTTPGRFSACEMHADCDQEHGFSCVNGTCSYECEQHSDCIEVGHCEAVTLDGARRQFCVADEKAPEPGKLYTACPNGDECADPLLCIGAGPGDLDAYCTVDCKSDDDCALGYYCGTLTRRPCQAACDQDAAPSDPLCAPPDAIGDGKPFYCNPLGGVERKVCRQREFCSPCEKDADCLAVPNQVCAKESRESNATKICTRLCDTGTRSCPWGNAAECAVFDEHLGQPTCAHRFGSCHGKGATCDPCRTNDDCPGGACTYSQFTGERWCINFDTRCECKNGVDNTGTCNDGGCPHSPGGLTVQCIGEPSSSLFDICYAANSGTDTLLGTSPQTGCWGPP
jgi:hypothetical protein